MNLQSFADDIADAHARVERRVGILKDNLHLAPHVAQLALRHGQQIFAEKIDFAAVGSIKRRIVRPKVDLPQPDSPTKPNVSPSSIVKLTPSTALTAPLPRENRPSPTGKCFFRLRISSKLMAY